MEQNHLKYLSIDKIIDRRYYNGMNLEIKHLDTCRNNDYPHIQISYVGFKFDLTSTQFGLGVTAICRGMINFDRNLMQIMQSQSQVT